MEEKDIFKLKTKSRLKRTLSGALALAMTASLASVIPASAEEISRYPYAIFAADESAGIAVNTDNFTLNGSAYTNGVFSATAQYPNINGTVTDADDIAIDDTADEENTEDTFDVSKDMILIHTKLADKYFTENCDTYDEDYTYSDMNVNINNAVYVTGKLNLYGNISLNNAVGAVSDVDLSGGNLNGNNTVIYSKFGDIDISNSQASVNGLIYAPFGTVTIDCDNFNMNGLIIAQNVVIDGYGANINYSSSWAELVGTESEELSWTSDDWQYLADTDDDGLPNLIEKEIGSDPYNPDTDGDNLPDGYEALTLGTDPTKSDTDDDGLDDGDEIYFETDPLNPDTDGNGVFDGNEKRLQTFIHEVENEDCAVTEVHVTMEGTGNIQKTTTVESIMNKDILCTDVVGLVGEPFSIETTSQFDTATLTYVIDKSKLGDTEFDNLLFLWYDEENDNFVELDTVLDEKNSTVSVETTHFSKYMIVNREEWYKAWSTELYPSYYDHIPIGLSTVLVIDCSGSMQYNDPYEAGRKKAAESFINVLRNKDNALKLKSVLGDDLNYTCFFKLAVEFELNAKKINLFPFDIESLGLDKRNGALGSEPRKIGNCLSAYNVKYDKFDITQTNNLKEIQEHQDNNGGVIFSAWNYYNGGVDLKYGVHTVYIEKDVNNIIIYNCSNSPTEPNTNYVSIEDMFTNTNPLFRTLVIGIWW